jgi:hypothetical protein
MVSATNCKTINPILFKFLASCIPGISDPPLAWVYTPFCLYHHLKDGLTSGDHVLWSQNWFSSLHHVLNTHTTFESCLLFPRVNSPFALTLEISVTPCLSTWEILRQWRLRRGSCHSCHEHNLDTRAQAKQFWQKKNTIGWKIYKRQIINRQWPESLPTSLPCSEPLCDTSVTQLCESPALLLFGSVLKSVQGRGSDFRRM